jgi:hypothetical protein
MIARLRRAPQSGSSADRGQTRALPGEVEPAVDAEPSPPVRPAKPPLPLPADGVVALNALVDLVQSRLGRQAAAALPLLGALHRSFVLLAPGYPAMDARPELWGFATTPATTLDELDSQLNRLEDILLQLLPTEVLG